ncbi:MAG: CsgG/HfaB family protein [bacterium]|nr:CsgG/HfaB family protein [bacterium]
MNRKIFIANLLILIMVVGCVRVGVRGRRIEQEIPKRLVTVIAFEDKTDRTFSSFWDIGKGMANELTEALVESEDFVVIEKRERFKGQALGFSPEAISQYAAIVKEILGVDAIITGDVDEFEIKEQEGQVRGRVRVVPEVAKVKLDIKIIDPGTGNILATETAEGQVSKKLRRRGRVAESDLTKLQRMDFGDKEFNRTTIGKATRLAINQAVKKVTEAFRRAHYPYYGERKEVEKAKKKEYGEDVKKVLLKGRIIKIEGDKFYINCGSSVGTKVGDIFTVYSLGEEIIDPLTGEGLGFEMKRSGEIQVIDVEDGYSISVIKSGQGFKINDVVKVE